MATGSSRIGPVLVALVVGVGGFLIGRSTAIIPLATTFTVYVGPSAGQLSIALSRSKADKVSWLPTDSTRTLFIDFAEQPFDGMQRQPNGRYRVQCLGGKCDSGSISQSALYNHDYKYWQTLTGLPEADGHIIIQN